MKSLESNTEGINTGFQTTTPRPWKKNKQEKALEEKKKIEETNRYKALKISGTVFDLLPQ